MSPAEPAPQVVQSNPGETAGDEQPLIENEDKDDDENQTADKAE